MIDRETERQRDRDRHRSTADKWAKEGGRVPPASVVVECKGGVMAWTAVLDCESCTFRRKRKKEMKRE